MLAKILDVKHVAAQVAEAAWEGGRMLGFGDAKVSDAEKGTLAEVGRAPNVTQVDPRTTNCPRGQSDKCPLHR